jgi:hypothetical protein
MKTKKITWTAIGNDLQARLKGRHGIVIRAKPATPPYMTSDAEQFLSLETLNNARQLLRSKVKRMRLALPPAFSLWIQYKGDPDVEFDQRLIKTVGARGKLTDRGHRGHTYVSVGRRDWNDLWFGFKSRTTAVAVAKKIKKLYTSKVKVTVSGKCWP